MRWHTNTNQRNSKRIKANYNPALSQSTYKQGIMGLLTTHHLSYNRVRCEASSWWSHCVSNIAQTYECGRVLAPHSERRNTCFRHDLMHVMRQYSVNGNLVHILSYLACWFFVLKASCCWRYLLCFTQRSHWGPQPHTLPHHWPLLAAGAKLAFQATTSTQTLTQNCALQIRTTCRV